MRLDFPLLGKREKWGTLGGEGAGEVVSVSRNEMNILNLHVAVADDQRPATDD